MYSAAIIEDTGCPPEDAAAVEEIMRTERPTLDSLTKVQFKQLARGAWSYLQALRVQDPETAAFYERRTYG